MWQAPANDLCSFCHIQNRPTEAESANGGSQTKGENTGGSIGYRTKLLLRRKSLCMSFFNVNIILMLGECSQKMLAKAKKKLRIVSA
jgi:hypothetical protein